ncbi:membrane protein [Virgisporangium aliadipatigenens]|uniref:Membrane protein n=1 Tax=Virgisporangium aliadipatigenens TaxID=741659 RepID=A0A8J3YG27_9ACTN|nr:zf-HC2 domain-containing protein [Virgisporangium aliadipatigenens]GIJ43578.1 membrane protein [Virgisporangium aliadipatigenens]
MTAHVPPAALAAYAGGEPALDDAAIWTLEAHLDGCAHCRGRLADLAPPPLADLLGEARTAILQEARTGPRPVARRRFRRWFLRWTDWSLLAWIVTTSVAILAAFLLDRNFPDRPSTVLLIAPVAPLAGLAVAWSRRANPNWELIAGTSRAGVELLLRRSLTVLAMVFPLLAAAGVGLGRNPALWLLPCLTFTGATLLLGGRVGVPTAAGLLSGGWLLTVLAATWFRDEPTVVDSLLRFETMPGWAAAALILAVTAVLRADDLRGPAHWR